MQSDRAKLAIAAGIASVILYKIYTSRKSEKWVKVGKISKLILYPLKSGTGISSRSLKMTKLGLAISEPSMLDRSFMVVKKSSKIMQNGRQIPKLVLIKTKVVDSQTLELSAPGMPSIKISPNSNTFEQINNCDISAKVQNCGEKAAEWITTFSDIRDADDNLIQFEMYYFDQKQSHRDGADRFAEEHVKLGKKLDRNITYKQTL